MQKKLLLWLFALLCSDALATHMRALEVTARRVNPDNPFEIEITITAYTDTRSMVPVGGVNEDILDFGDGTRIFVPVTPSTPRPDLGPNIGIAVYKVTHTFPGNGRYLLSYSEGNRNGGVLNVPLSGTTPIYVETLISIGPFANTYPQLLVPPIDRACSGVAFFHNPGAFDADGDSLAYELVVPLGNGPVAGYTFPDNASYYATQPPTNEEGTGPLQFAIDPATGLLTWDAPGISGEYNIAIRINEWRKDPVTGQFQFIGSLIRDMQIIVEDCANNRPELIVPPDICVEPGTYIDERVYGTDPDNDPIKLEAYSEVFEWPTEQYPATYDPTPAFVPPPAELRFQWEVKSLHVREQPYSITYKATDQPAASDPMLATYKIWRIKVVAPAPGLHVIVPDLVRRHAQLSWNPYTVDAVDVIQIWRRVDTYTFFHNGCDIRVPSSLGYQLLDEVDPTTTQYTDTNQDKGLSVGARYCYRIVARMSNGTLSLLSDEQCMDPIQVDAPMITHVTLENTAPKEGSIRVSWRSPFEISQTQFPKPWRYEIYRGKGIDHGGMLTPVALVGDTTYLDTNLNTEDTVYHYTIVLYSTTLNNPEYSAVDTSATASSIHLQSAAGPGSVSLGWSANVPWSNFSQRYPRHLIYRGVYGTPESALTLIDSVDVSEAGFMYTDTGTYLNTPLDDNTYYCYKVVTRGVYGNPGIDEPLLNASPMTCTYPVNNLPVCAPALTIEKPDCDTFLNSPVCESFELSNTISWEEPSGPGCRLDIESYILYAANGPGDEFEPIATNIRDLTYVDGPLASQARCYKVKAINKEGTESDLSDLACGDNCTYFELPNIFTPNNDGCNDLFAAFNPHTDDGEELQCPVIDIFRCPRFATAVDFSVYDRWGLLLFKSRYEGSDIYINWNGRDNKGNELASATYYYIAEVTFDSHDPARKRQRYNGWLHLLR